MKDYNTTVYNSTKNVEKFFKKTFKNISFSGPPFPETELNNNPTMIVCSHRSHLDYILLGAKLNKAGLRNMRFAAGENLTRFPLIGKKFRSWGAFTVNRSRAQSRKYILELCYDVVRMLNNNNKIIVFPEGGRSYQGNMMEMKNGFIAANIFAQFHSPEKQYCFLPVSISYEILPELKYFDILQKGKKIRKSGNGIVEKMKGHIYYYGADLLAFAKFIVAHKFGAHYGEVFIDYSDPIVINDIIDIKKHFKPGMRSEFAAHKVAIKRVGNEIRNKLRSLYRILPIHLISSIIESKGSCTISEAMEMIPEMLEMIDKQQLNNKSLKNMTDQEIIEKGVRQLELLKAIKKSHKKIEIKYPRFIKYYAATIEQK